MFFTYSASVVLISLAIYGIFCFLQDMWSWYCRQDRGQQLSVSLIILVQDAEHKIEHLMYDLIYGLEEADGVCDAVVVDCGSDDLTYQIASRMAEVSEDITVLRFYNKPKPVNEVLPLCQGTVVHVIDLVSRVSFAQFSPTVSRLLSANSRLTAVDRD